MSLLYVFGWLNPSHKQNLPIPTIPNDFVTLTARTRSCSAVAINHSVALVMEGESQHLQISFNESLQCYYGKFLSESVQELNDQLLQVCSSKSMIRRLLSLTENMFVVVEHINIPQVIRLVDFLSLTKRTLNFPQTEVTSIAGCENHVLMRTIDGRAFALGRGKYGQLGLGPSIIETLQPEEIMFPQGEFVREVATGPYHSCCITGPYGHVYSFGCSSYGRLGLAAETLKLHSKNDTDCVFLPIIVEDLVGIGELLPNGTTSGAALIACGQWHSIVVAHGTNDVYGWGWNKFGQLGSSNRSEIIDEPERLSALDDDSMLGSDFDGPNRVVKVGCGSSFSALATQGGRVIIM
jgi:hypothetical protein